MTGPATCNALAEADNVTVANLNGDAGPEIIVAGRSDARNVLYIGCCR